MSLTDINDLIHSYKYNVHLGFYTWSYIFFLDFGFSFWSSSRHLHWQHQVHFWCLQRCCDSVARALLWEHESPAAVVLLTCRQLLANSATIVPAAFCLPSRKGAEARFSITQHIRCLGQHNETKWLKKRRCFLLAWSTVVYFILLNNCVWTGKTWFLARMQWINVRVLKKHVVFKAGGLSLALLQFKTSAIYNSNQALLHPPISTRNSYSCRDLLTFSSKWCVCLILTLSFSVSWMWVTDRSTHCDFSNSD